MKNKNTKHAKKRTGRLLGFVAPNGLATRVSKARKTTGLSTSDLLREGLQRVLTEIERDGNLNVGQS